MKRLLVVLLLLIASGVSGSAQSMLKVRLADNSRLNVEVDGRYFNKTGTSVTVGDLPEGRHKFKIYTVEQDRRGRARQEAIYTGKVVTHTGYVTLFTFDPGSMATDVQEQDINSYAQNNPAIPRGGDGSQYDNTTAPQVNNNNSDYGNDNKYIEPSAPVASPVAPEAIGTLTDAKTNDLKTKTADRKTDTEKMNLLRDALKDEKITTEQVALIMDWFSFESSKVDFAKWAYANTVDKENFGTLDTKLTYKNYEDELAKFIQDNSK